MEAELHYLVLDLELGASQDEIKEAYRCLAKVWHPDRFTDDPKLQRKAEEKLKRINAAYLFLKSYQPQAEQSDAVLLNCEKLEKLLKLGQFEDADHETKRLLLELAGRENEGWLLPTNVGDLSRQGLAAIDRLWVKHSYGRFGFSVQAAIWRRIGCISSGEINLQTSSENKFGKSVHWHKNGSWLHPWDSFNYSIQAPEGSLPREYVFSLSGWWAHSKGWIGYLLLRFDDVFLKL